MNNERVVQCLHKPLLALLCGGVQTPLLLKRAAFHTGGI